MERRQGKDKGVIAKALVELDGFPFKALVAQRKVRLRGVRFVPRCHRVDACVRTPLVLTFPWHWV